MELFALSMFFFLNTLIHRLKEQVLRVLTDKIEYGQRESGPHHPRTDSQGAIGHSSNAPWPNLKKLTVPASTTAMMTDLLPWRSATNGLIFIGAGVGGEEYNEK